MGMGAGMGYPPPRPGLGIPHSGPGTYSPAPSYGGPGGSGPGGRPAFVKEVKTTKVFVGSISPGITDQTLEELLNVS
jgi:hypothetical protein